MGTYFCVFMLMLKMRKMYIHYLHNLYDSNTIHFNNVSESYCKILIFSLWIEFYTTNTKPLNEPMAIFKQNSMTL